MLIGLDISDDAAVYQLNSTTILVQTVDFFPPIVDDPYTYGSIAAANALSDIYAMGGTPFMALVIAALPADLPPQISAAILQGGADKAAEAGVVIGGGHTINDREPKYGLCVTGLVNPQQITPKAGAKLGDVLLLTKPLGTGIITTAIKRKEGLPEHLEAAVDSMLLLNRQAAELAKQVEIHSATDITGFGLVGHAAEIARNSGVGFQIDTAALPLLPGALEYARAGIMPGGLTTNRDYFQEQGILQCEGVDAALVAIACDPQTSGGLLFVLSEAAAEQFEQLTSAANQLCQRIGQVVAEPGIRLT